MPKTLKQCTLLDRFLFDQTMDCPEAHEAALQIILNDPGIRLLTPAQTEKELRTAPWLRSIRLDVFALDETLTIYSTEMQKKYRADLVKRSRYYQALVDSSLLEPGSLSFNQLNNAYIILIMPFDLFGLGKYCYTFQTCCRENNELWMEDGITRIFLNTRGMNDEEVGKELRDFLHYIERTDERSALEAGSERIDRVVELILREMPDTIGVQECSEVWYEALTGRLSQYYGVVGEINDTNWQRWRNAVFYRKDRFRLVETSTQWLSPTPGTMSKLPDTPQYRVLTTAVLEDLQTGARLTHCNTHMSFEEAVREAQFNILMQLVGRTEGPVILTGDFNVTSSSRYYTMIQDAGMHNAMDLTRHQDPANTCGASAIDFCFVREEDINVLTHTVLDEENRNQELSDHCPVLITYTLVPHHQIS